MFKISTPFLLFITFIFVAVSTPGCEQVEPPDTSEFTLQDEIKLGQQLQEAVQRNSDQYPVLDETDHANLYTYTNGLLDVLAQTGNVDNINTGFNWGVKIIEDPASSKAFALPGGPVYISTGLLELLETEHEFLALLAHEMAYADRNLLKNFLADEFGYTVLLDVSLGSNDDIADMLLDLIANAQYPKEITKIADDYSVELVCPTTYDATGLVKILQRATAEPSSQSDWLNNRPGNEDRQASLLALIDAITCDGTETGENNYQEFLTLLP